MYHLCSIEVLENPSIIAIYMSLPAILHVKWALKASEKGKHMLLEKQFVLTVKELDLILRKCELSRVQFTDTTMWMHHRITEKVRQLLLDPAQMKQLRKVSQDVNIEEVACKIEGYSGDDLTTVYLDASLNGKRHKIAGKTMNEIKKHVQSGYIKIPCSNVGL